MKTRKTYRNSQLHRTLIEVLIERRLAAKMTQLEVSDTIGRPPEFCNKVERGTRVLNAMEYIVYCRGIKSTAEYVSGEVERRMLLKRMPLK